MAAGPRGRPVRPPRATASRGRSRPGSSCKGELERAEARGLRLKVGAEAEYFLVRRTDGGGIEVADPLDRAGAPCYDAKGLTRMYDHLTTVSRHMNALGWANYANDHEDANGQFEQNFRYADALTTRRPGDRVPLHGPHAGRTQAGHARHLHAQAVHRPDRERPAHALSACGTRRPAPSCSPTPADARGLGLSPLAYSVHRPGCSSTPQALAAVTCPTVNSYKRLSASAPRLPARPGRRPTPPTAATTGPTCCGSPTAAGSRTAASTGRPIPTWP